MDEAERLYRAVGANMGRLRRRANRTQDAVGARLGVSQGTISKWERGDLPTLREIIRFAEAIDVPPGEVLRPLLGDVQPLTERQLVLIDELLATAVEQGRDA